MIRLDQISSSDMKTLSVSQVARNFSSVLHQVEKDQEEIVLIRNRRQIARIIPEPPAQDALRVLGDLYRALDDETADALRDAVVEARKGKKGRGDELRNPWGS